jgi:uncharacterized membrane protein
MPPTTDAARVADRAAGLHTEGLERILAFSDGVFAIAITLLILDIRLPGAEVHLSDAELFEQLKALWPKLFAYLLSFAVVAIFWVKHHATFRGVKAYDARLVWANMLLLLVVSFIPFPTAVMSAQRNGVAMAFYASTMAVGFALSAWIWWHVGMEDRLGPSDLDQTTRRSTLWSSIAAAGVFLLAALVALVDVHWGRWMLLLIIPVSNSRLWSWTGKRGR